MFGGVGLGWVWGGEGGGWGRRGRGRGRGEGRVLGEGFVIRVVLGLGDDFVVYD